jgi:tankyrase
MSTSTPQKDLIEAVKRDDVELMQDCVIAGADVQAKDSLDHTLLHFACKVGSHKIAEVLIRYHLDVNYEDTKGVTPLHYACANDNMEMVELLLNNGANIRAKDMNGWTPLHWASAKGRFDIAKRLIDAGSNVKALNSTHSTAIDLDSTGTLKEFLTQRGNAIETAPASTPSKGPNLTQW